MTISIRLTAEEEERLDGLARRTGRSKSFMSGLRCMSTWTILKMPSPLTPQSMSSPQMGGTSQRLSALREETER